MMKKLVIINAIPYGSTGKIVRGIADCAKRQQYEVYTFYSWTKALKKSSEKNIYVGLFWDKALHILLAKITGLNGCFGIVDTYLLINRLKKIKPDVINLHILHCWNINLPMLFNYLKKEKIKVIWTMHDCWAVTGQCPCFTMVKCNKWINGCYECQQYQNYPGAFVDQTKLMWKLKRKWFTSIEKMIIVTPSQWLAGIMNQSFLRQYPVKVINNGINLNIFKPIHSNFKIQHKCENKFIVLGVAFDWGKRKGLDVFIKLAKLLDERYQIILVGTNNKIEQLLPNNIISIHRTENQIELAKIYTAADVFVNPTREDNFPTVNLEALACGTPVITFNTGGSPECIDKTCGIVVDCDDITELVNKINLVCNQKIFTEENCRIKAKNFDINKKLQEYLQLF